MMLQDLAGTYTGTVTWRDTRGGQGSLSETVVVESTSDGVAFQHDDGSGMYAEATALAENHVTLHGKSEEVGTTGTLYLADHCMILDYVAHVRGREERNTDVWTFSGTSVARAGVIRQADRTIWFEGGMERTG